MAAHIDRHDRPQDVEVAGGAAAPALRLLAAYPGLSRGFGISTGIAAFVICLLVTYDIFTRTLFAMSNSWVTEVCIYLMAYIAFGGAAYALREGAHVRVNLLLHAVPPRVQRVLGVTSDAVMLVMFALLSWLGFEFWQDAWASGERSTSLLAAPLWMPYLFFVLGMVWLLVELVVHMTGGSGRREAAGAEG